MKKKVAIMLTLILATGTFTACTSEGKVNNSSLSPTASTSVGVSVSGDTSVQTNSSTAEKETTKTTEKATVSKETEPSEKDTKSKEKADSEQNSAVVSATAPVQETQSEI